MIGQTLNNRYKITSRLGKGAMGIVYKATDIQSGREVALKVISGSLEIESEFLQRFKREGETLQQLKHPHIVEFLDAFEYEENYVIVMEYVSGGNLHDLIKKGKLSIKHANHIALGLCDALIHSHKLGIIHRDIKPENILLKDDGTPKLADFGVARLNEATRMTRSGTQVGTPYYMAPEAWEGKHLDAQADIWSLGVVIFEMLTGEVPFGGDTGAAVMNKVLTSNPPNIKSLRKEIPSSVVKIVNRMLTRDKNRRYQTMWEVITDLERNQPKTSLLSTKRKSDSVKQSVSIKIWFGGLIGIIGILAISGFFIKQISTITSSPTSSIISTAFILSTQTQQLSIPSTPTISAPSTPFSIEEPIQPDNWELVYVGGSTGKQDLFIVALDNPAPQNLSDSLGYFFYSAFTDAKTSVISNPVNSFVAYIFGTYGSQEVYIVDSQQYDKIKADIDGSTFYGLNYSYSGNYLAVLGNSLQIVDNSGSRVATNSLKELKRGSYSNTVSYNTFVWSPTKDQIAFWYFPVLGTQAGAQLSILDVEKDSYVLVDIPVNSTAGGNIFWVNENQIIVTIQSGVTQLYSIHISGNQYEIDKIDIPFITTYSWSSFFDLSPNKASIAASDIYDKEISIFDTNGNLLVDIKNEIWNSWSPKSDYFLTYSQTDWYTADNLFVRTLQSASPIEITPDVTYRYWIYPDSIAWSPTGEYFLFLVCSDHIAHTYNPNDYGLCDLYVSSYDGKLTKITREPGYFSKSVAPSWSPDGTLIAYITGEETGNLIVTSSDGTEHQTLDENAYYNSSIHWVKSSPNQQEVGDTTLPAINTQENITIDSTATSIPSSSILGIGSTLISEKDGMNLVYVPAGEFIMGSDNGSDDEKPVHTVFLDAYWIDQTEVTNAMYAKCVEDGDCTPPVQTVSSAGLPYYGNVRYHNFPVKPVDWHMAQTYCEWAGRRLPTEAEWEKASRGTDGRTYPWGDANPNNTLANYFSYGVGDATEVGMYPDGASIYSAFDMAGNVSEWVNDWYDPNYYQKSPSSNPQGPTSGEYKVQRGGSWGIYTNDFYYNIRSAYRGWYDQPHPNTYSNSGFRCSRSP